MKSASSSSEDAAPDGEPLSSRPAVRSEVMEGWEAGVGVGVVVEFFDWGVEGSGLDFGPPFWSLGLSGLMALLKRLLLAVSICMLGTSSMNRSAVFCLLASCRRSKPPASHES